MLEPGMKMFLNFPNESKTLILHPGTTKEAGECGYTVELEESDLAVEAGQDVFIYYELNRKLVKQAARIDAAMNNAEAHTDRRFDFGRSVLSGPPGQPARACALVEDRQVGKGQRGTTPAGLTTSAADRPSLATVGSRAVRSKRAH